MSDTFLSTSAASPAAPDETDAASTSSVALGLGSTAVWLAFVLVLAWGVLRTIKQVRRRKSSRSGAGADSPQVLHVVSLGPAQRLVAVRHREREYLLGVTAGAVCVIDNWPAESESD